MANYVIDEILLRDVLPQGTELEMWRGQCYVSVVGFMFLDTKIKGITIPFHRNFEEVNLRFYVRYNDKGEWKRGVVFIKELVPKPALTFVANTLYGEHYQTLKMGHDWQRTTDEIKVNYWWYSGRKHSISATASPQAEDIITGSEEEFITEHYWGYTKTGEVTTSEYAVEHPRWKVYPIREYSVDIDFGAVYGNVFSFLSRQKPQSVLLAEGSKISVSHGRTIK